jgi:hypothetical protein|tara:strand:+ start:1084 stop:1551 length:468 start_codon:yes stop_codon:yes gene_type:complete
MAHFAELKSMTDPTGFTSDTHQVVQRVVVVGNDIAAGSGTLGDNDMHVDGETWCINFFKGGSWKQTSYNNNFRKQYCGIGFVYDSTKDKFLSPQPWASWSLNSDDDWQAPVTYPTDTTDKKISWDEPNLRWTAEDMQDPPNNFNWDASALAWVSA